MIFSPNNQTRQTVPSIDSCRFAGAPVAPLSPIDSFLEEKQRLLLLTNPSHQGGSEPALLGLIFLGIISSVENYYRRIVSETFSVDPNSRKIAENESITFREIDWYGMDDIGNAFVDDGSLADPDKIVNIVKSIIGFDIKKDDTIRHAIDKFDIVCQIRHCLVHANGHIRGINAMRLGIDINCIGGKVDLTLPFLHEVIAYCEHLVRETNCFLFDKIMIRLFKTGTHRFSQDYSKDKVLFEKVFKIYLSVADMQVSPSQRYFIYRKYIKRLF